MTKSFHLHIIMENAAFEDSPVTELGNILAQLTDDIRAGDFAIGSIKLRDSNGNTVGRAEYEGD
jgi:hypothetical protein